MTSFRINQHNFSLPAALPPSVWEAGLSAWPRWRVSDDKPIYHQGGLVQEIYCVLSGHIKLTRVTPDGDQFIVAILSAGALFGPVSGTASATTESAYSKSDTELLRIGVAQFRNLANQHPDLLWHLLAMQETHQRILQRRLECLMFQDVRARLAEMLCLFASHYGQRCEHGYEIDVQLTQQELAEWVGASRPMVSTILNELRESGVLVYTRQLICINQIETLERLRMSALNLLNS